MNQEHAFEHLLALCNNQNGFAITKYSDGKLPDYQRIGISDIKKGQAQGFANSIIGTIRLLPTGEQQTTIMFVDKDALYFRELTPAENGFFEQFIMYAENHFAELNLLIAPNTAQAQTQNYTVNIGHDVKNATIILGDSNTSSNETDISS